MGGILRAVYKGRWVEVHRTEGGFRFEGRDYDSLTAIAMEVTTAAGRKGRVSGNWFFGLGDETACEVCGLRYRALHTGLTFKDAVAQRTRSYEKGWLSMSSRALRREIGQTKQLEWKEHLAECRAMADFGYEIAC